MSQEKKETYNNVYAKNEKGESLHISMAESGNNGYFCLGCDAEMIARKGEINEPHFAHVPNDVKVERKCVYSNETHRHEIAKEILQRIKKVKVPPLYKFPLKRGGKAMKLKDAVFITSPNVKNELQFYENELGEIKWGRNIEENNNKFLIIRPDVTFFNEEGKPILFVELVATHKVDKEKLSKIKRIGIDTIEIKIPKDSEQNIENTFSSSSKTKWLYNHEQEETKYNPIYATEEVSRDNEFERRNFQFTESYECKKAEISNFTRRIEKYLGTEQFEIARKKLYSEIARTEENTERERTEIQEFEDRIEKEIQEEFRAEEEKFQFHNTNLESRYFRKRGELEIQQNDLGNEERKYSLASERTIEELKSRVNSTRVREQELRGEINDAEGEQTRRRLELQKVREDISDIQARTEEFRKRTKSIRVQQEELSREFEDDKEGLGKEFESRKIKIREEFRELRNKLDEAIKNINLGEESTPPRRIRNLLEEWEKIQNIRKEQYRIKRLKFIKELFETKAYKNWI